MQGDERLVKGKKWDREGSKREIGGAYSEFSGTAVNSNMDDVEWIGRSGNGRTRIRLHKTGHEATKSVLLFALYLVAVTLSRTAGTVGRTITTSATGVDIAIAVVQAG